MFRIILAVVLGLGVSAAAYYAKPFLSPPKPSIYISSALKQAVASVREEMAPNITELMTGDSDHKRSILDEYYLGPRIQLARKFYRVIEQPLEINGIYTEVFEPTDSIPIKHTDRVLINLHGSPT